MILHSVIFNRKYRARIELAGGTTPKYMQGKSFKTILETGTEPADWQKATYYRYWMHLAHRHQNPTPFGIRTEDPKEMNNAYKDLTYSETIADLKKQLIQMREDLNETDTTIRIFKK